jgi:hypothetical protein
MQSEAINALTGVHSLKPSDSRQPDAPTRRTFTFTAAGAPRPPLSTRQANQTSPHNHQVSQATQRTNGDVLVTQIAHPSFDTHDPTVNLPRLLIPSANRSTESPQDFIAQKRPCSSLAGPLPLNPALEVKGRRKTFGNFDQTHGAVRLTSNHAMDSNPPRPDFTRASTPVVTVRPGLAGLGIANEGKHHGGSITSLPNKNSAFRHPRAPAYTPVRELSHERYSTPSVYSQSLDIGADGGDGVDEDGTISIKVFNAILATNKEKDRKLRSKVNVDPLPAVVEELMTTYIGRGNSGAPSKRRGIRRKECWSTQRSEEDMRSRQVPSRRLH